VPNALQFKQSLKIHSVSQYLQVINNTNYEQDKGAFLINFLKNSLKNNRRNNISSKIPVIPDYVVYYILLLVTLFVQFPNYLQFVKVVLIQLDQKHMILLLSIPN